MESSRPVPQRVRTTSADDSSSQSESSLDERVDVGEAPSAGYTKYFSFIRKVGEGSFSSAWLAVNRRTKKRVLAKILVRTEKNRQYFDREYKLSRLFSKHPDVIYTYPEAYENDNHRMIIQEYADGGDLCGAITECVGVSQVRARRYLGQIAAALQYIHASGYVHRDVKPENIVLVNKPYVDKFGKQHEAMTITHAKLIDFGLACPIGTEMTATRQSIPYLPPELVSPKRGQASPSILVTPALDSWSLGVTLFTMLTGQFPWSRANKDDQCFIEFSHWQEVDSQCVPSLFQRFSWQLLELFSQLMAIEPEARCSVATALAYLDVDWFWCAGDDSAKYRHRLAQLKPKHLSRDSSISTSSTVSVDSGSSAEYSSQELF